MSHLLCGYSKEIIPSTKKRDDCTLVEVPPHGRLVDIDAVISVLEEMSKEYPPDSIGRYWISIFFDILKAAPTVIEADVSEEELQREYEANVEYAQYCERYESTYDPNTGAM